jgi:hypothetical protein
MRPAGWVGDEGIRGVPSSWRCIDNVRATIEFPHTQERALDGRRCHTSVGEEVIPAPALRRSVVCRGRPAPLA